MIAWNGCSRSRGTRAQHVWNAHKLDDPEVAQHLPAGSTGLAAIYTDHIKASHLIPAILEVGTFSTFTGCLRLL
jgi:hypothetical protein